MGLLRSFFHGEEDAPRAEGEPIPAKAPTAKPPGRQFTDEDRKKAVEARRAKSSSREEGNEATTEVPSIQVQREVVRLLKELQKSGITIDALIILVADAWRPSRHGRPLNWSSKKQIVAEIFKATQHLAEKVAIKEI